MAGTASRPLVWTAVTILVAALVPMVVMTLAVAAVAWIPFVVALAVAALILAFAPRRLRT